MGGRRPPRPGHRRARGTDPTGEKRARSPGSGTGDARAGQRCSAHAPRSRGTCRRPCVDAAAVTRPWTRPLSRSLASDALGRTGKSVRFSHISRGHFAAWRALQRTALRGRGPWAGGGGGRGGVPSPRVHSVRGRRARYRLHLTAMSNMSLHCMGRVRPPVRTLALAHVRCTACMTSSAAKPMAAGATVRAPSARTWHRDIGHCARWQRHRPHTGDPQHCGVRGAGPHTVGTPSVTSDSPKTELLTASAAGAFVTT